MSRTLRQTVEVAMAYGIAYVDRRGNKRPMTSHFSTKAKAEKVAKDLNAAVKIKGNGKYVVIEI